MGAGLRRTVTVTVTLFGKAIQREQQLIDNKNFIGPKPPGTDVKGPAFNLKDSSSYFTRTNDTVDIAIDKIIPTKSADNKGIPVAKKLMSEAAGGQRGKRGPLSVIDNGDGTYRLMDGNATWFASKDMELETLPVRIVTEEQYIKEAAALKIRKAEEDECIDGFFISQGYSYLVNLERTILEKINRISLHIFLKIFC
mgnify:CR=1 FL=1